MSPDAVRSANVGYFFKSPNLDCRAAVKKGQRLGVVKMLGVEFAVHAHYAGWVDQIVVPCGTPVDYGQCLMVLRSSPPL